MKLFGRILFVCAALALTTTFGCGTGVDNTAETKELTADGAAETVEKDQTATAPTPPPVTPPK